MAKKNKGSNVAKNQKFNVEDHIASTPTGPRKKTYPHVFSWYSTVNTNLLIEIILQSNRVWDQVYPYRHVDVRNISLGERDYEPVLMWPRQVSPTRILPRHPYHGKLPQ